MQSHIASAHFGLGRMLRLARKELTEILRDRRTIVTLVVMPLLLYPLLTFAFSQFVQGANVAAVVPQYNLGFESAADQRVMWAHLERGMKARRQGAASSAQPEMPPKIYEDLDEAVRQRRIDLGFRAPKAAQPNAADGAWQVVYREDDEFAREAFRYVEQVSAAADADLLREQLRGLHLPPAPSMRLVAVQLPSEDSGRVSLAVFVPLVLILMTITGAVYPAIDLTAGERERGTLEVLIAAPVPRVSLLFGKYVAVMTVAVLTALVNLGSMTISLLISGFTERVFGPGGLHIVTLLEIFGLVLLFAAFFSAVLLVLTSFARSFKEAQAYLIPLMVVALVPGILGLLPGLPLSGPLAVVPLLNIVLLARDLLEGRADFLSAAVVVISTMAYAVLAIALAARVFGAEGVLYGETAGWRALLRRQVR